MSVQNSDAQDNGRTMRNDGGVRVRDGDWRELAWRLRCEHWDIFRVVLELLRVRLRTALRAPEVVPPKRGMLPAEDDDEDDVL